MASEVDARDAGKLFFFSYILTPGSTQAEAGPAAQAAGYPVRMVRRSSGLLLRP